MQSITMIEIIALAAVGTRIVDTSSIGRTQVLTACTLISVYNEEKMFRALSSYQTGYCACESLCNANTIIGDIIGYCYSF